MKTFSQQLRWRIVQALVGLVFLAAIPWGVAEIAPSLSAFVPPPQVFLLLAFTTIEVLLLLRPERFFEKLFPGQPIPSALLLSGQSLRTQQITLLVSVIVTIIMIVQWFRMLP